MNMDKCNVILLGCMLVVLLLGKAAHAMPYQEDRVTEDKPRYNNSPQVFRGKFTGSCFDDGIYYQDIKSFVLCAHGNSYVMPCSPGTQNDDFFYYKRNIGKNDKNVRLCDVNLVDIGYGQIPEEQNTYYYDSPEDFSIQYSASDNELIYNYNGIQDSDTNQGVIYKGNSGTDDYQEVRSQNTGKKTAANENSSRDYMYPRRQYRWQR